MTEKNTKGSILEGEEAEAILMAEEKPDDELNTDSGYLMQFTHETNEEFGTESVEDEGDQSQAEDEVSNDNQLQAELGIPNDPTYEDEEDLPTHEFDDQWDVIHVMDFEDDEDRNNNRSNTPAQELLIPSTGSRPDASTSSDIFERRSKPTANAPKPLAGAESTNGID